MLGHVWLPKMLRKLSYWIKALLYNNYTFAVFEENQYLCGFVWARRAVPIQNENPRQIWILKWHYTKTAKL
jgi:hypothetical protein